MTSSIAPNVKAFMQLWNLEYNCSTIKLKLNRYEKDEF